MHLSRDLLATSDNDNGGKVAASVNNSVDHWCKVPCEYISGNF
jgi:hypothetical protein